MVVDDDASTRMSCKQLLVENGYDVAEAANRIEAISVYSDFQPDMVFMDITMPDMDGLIALQEIMVMDPNAKVAMAIVMGQQALVMVALKTGAVDFVIKPFDQVLDVGAGSGILSVGAAKLGAGRVIGVEIDKIAVKAGRANLRANGVSGKVRCYAGTLPNDHVPSGWADIVLANVNSVALVNLAPELRRALKPGGWLVGAGILEERRASVEAAFAAAGLKIRERLRDDDWVAMLCQ